MTKTRIIAAASLIAWFASCNPATAADSAAGQKVFEGACAACHKLKMAPYAGKSESELETDVKGIVGGTIKHPTKLTLSAADIANVATYISSNNSK
ncbi:MAG: hypothetical protein ABSG18_05070 [Steroidobacteraceae bacterium]|jgi:mono/diheme cytochrome c family protein